ncbi:hypothetical protein SDC9_207547 [bioreactor metagenome]|uniref:Uncharacterized protein n=1 Tax=bioreactor metagenome TaxID=1076179 RepID=A0A645J7Z1_9ZZZZ
MHLGVGPLHRIQLNARGIFSRIDRRYGTAAHADAVVVTTQHHHLLAAVGIAFSGIALVGIAHATGKHDYLVVTKLLVVLGVFKGEYRAADQRLAEFVAKVGGTV